MEPRFIDRPDFIVVGVTAVGQPGELNYGEIWEKGYMPMDEQLKPHSIDGGYYGVTLSVDSQQTYLAGMAVSGLPALPPSAEQYTIPAAHYAVFDCPMNAIGATWHHVYDEWLPASAYVLDTSAVDFEYYPPNGGTGDVQCQIHIPVRVKEAVG